MFDAKNIFIGLAMISPDESQLADPSQVAQELLVIQINCSRNYGQLANLIQRYGLGPVAEPADFKYESNASVKIVGGVIMKACPPVFSDGGLCSRVFLMKPVGNTEVAKVRFRIVLQLKRRHSDVNGLKEGDYLAVYDPKSYRAFKMENFYVGPGRVLLWVSPGDQVSQGATQAPLVSPVVNVSPASTRTVVSRATLVTKNIKTSRHPATPQNSSFSRRVEKPRVLTRPEMPPPSGWINVRPRPQRQPRTIDSIQGDSTLAHPVESRHESSNKAESTLRSNACHRSCSLTAAHHRGCSSCRPTGCCSSHDRHHCCGSGHSNKSTCNCYQQPACAHHSQCVSCCPSNSGVHCHQNRSFEQTSCSRVSCSFHHSHGHRCDGCLSSTRSVSNHCGPSYHSLKPTNSSASQVPHQPAAAAHRTPEPSHESPTSLHSGSSERPEWFVSKWVEQTRLQNEQGPFTQESQRATCGNSRDDILSDDDTFTSISQIAREKAVLLPEEVHRSNSRQPAKSANLLLARDNDSDSDASDTSNLFLQPNKSLLNRQPGSPEKAEVKSDTVVKSAKRSAPQGPGFPKAPVVREAKKRKLFVPSDSSWLFDPSKPSTSRQEKLVGSDDASKKDVIDGRMCRERDLSSNSFLSVDSCSALQKQDDKTHDGQSQVSDSQALSSHEERPKEDTLTNETSGPVEIDDADPSKLEKPTDSSEISSPSQSPLPTKGEDLISTGRENLQEQTASLTALDKSHISTLLMEWDSEPGSGDSNDKESAAPKTVEELMKDLCGETNDRSESASDDACKALSNIEFLHKPAAAKSDGNQESYDSFEKEPAVDVVLSSDQCNVVSQTSDELVDTDKGEEPSGMSIEKSQPVENCESGNCENLGDEKLMPDNVLKVSDVVMSPTDSDHQHLVEPNVEDLGRTGKVSGVPGCSPLMENLDFGTEYGTDMSLTFYHPPEKTNSPSRDSGEVQEPVDVPTSVTPQEEQTPHSADETSCTPCEPQETQNLPSDVALNPTTIPPKAPEGPGMPKVHSEPPTTQHSSQSDLNLRLTSQTPGDSGPSEQPKSCLNDSRCLTPDSTTKGISQDWLNSPASPSSTVYFDAEGDDESVSRANEEGQMEGQQDSQQFEGGISDGVVKVRDLKAGLQGEIVDMVPRIAEDNYTSIVKGICRLGCRSLYDYESVMSRPIINKSCSHCNFRGHHICPSCRKKRLKKPLCLLFNFELHVSVGRNILRLRVHGEEATNFLGVSVKHYLRKATLAKDLIRQLKLFSSVDLDEGNPRFKGHFYFETTQLNNSFVPILVNTSISDFRVSVKASL